MKSFEFTVDSSAPFSSREGMRPSTADPFTEQDVASIALNKRPQADFLATIPGRRRSQNASPLPSRQVVTALPVQYPMALPAIPWQLDPSNERGGKIRIVDRHGVIVAIFKDENVALLVVNLVNRARAGGVAFSGTITPVGRGS